MLASFPVDSKFNEQMANTTWYDFMNCYGTLMLIVLRWLGEKYDGVRLCWNPKRDTMYQTIFFF